jgi:hypothetical protein
MMKAERGKRQRAVPGFELGKTTVIVLAIRGRRV